MKKLVNRIEEHNNGQYPEGSCIRELCDKSLEMEKAMDEFIQKCDLGLARSTYTYNLFKQILEK